MEQPVPTTTANSTNPQQSDGGDDDDSKLHQVVDNPTVITTTTTTPLRLSNHDTVHFLAPGKLVRPWRRMVTVVHNNNGTSSSSWHNVDDANALSAKLAAHVRRKLLRLVVSCCVTTTRGVGGGAVVVHYEGQAGILVHHSQQQQQQQQQQPQPASLDAKQQTTFQGRIVTVSRNLATGDLHVRPFSTVLFRPGSARAFSYPGCSSSSSSSSSAPVPGTDPGRRRCCSYRGSTSKHGITWSAPTAFATDTFGPFVQVRDDFFYRVGQCVGMAVYSSLLGSGSGRSSGSAGASAVPSAVPRLVTNRRHGASVYMDADCMDEGIDLGVVYGREPHVVNIYTGKITFVGDRHIEYDVNTFGGCAGAVVFLLDRHQPRNSVCPIDYGRAIAVHAGTVGMTTYGFKLAGCNPQLHCISGGCQCVIS